MSEQDIRDLDPDEEVVQPEAPEEEEDGGGLPDAPKGPLQVKGALDDLSYAASPLAIARASLATKPETKIKRYSSSMGQPESDFALEGDEVVRKLKPGEVAPQIGGADIYARVEPSIGGGGKSGLEGRLDTAARVGDAALSQVGPSIPAITGGAAALLAAPTLGGMGAAGFGGAAAGEVGREMGDKWLAGESLAPGNWGENYDRPNIFGQGALQAVAPFFGAAAARAGAKVLPPVVGGLLEMARGDNPAVFNDVTSELAHPIAKWVKSLTYDNPLDLDGPAWNALRSTVTPEKMTEIAQLRQEAARNGVDMSLDQVTGNYAIGQRLRQLLRFPETAQGVVDFRLKQQGEQIPQAFLNKINELLPSGQQLSPEAAIKLFREGANDIVQKTLTQRTKEANLNFGTALDRIPKDPTSGVPERYWTPEIQEIFETGPGRAGVANAIKINNAIPASRRPKLTVPTYDGNGKLVGEDFAPDWRSLDYIRKGMKADIDAHTDAFGKVDAYGREAKKTYKDFVGNLTAKNPAYGTSLALYGDASDSVDIVLKGGAGMLQGMKGMDRQAVLDRVFSGNSMMPDDMTKMRQLFVDTKHENEWEAATSAWLRSRLNDALTVNRQGGEVGNVSGKLFQGLYGQPEDKRLMAAALGDPKKVESMDKFMNVLQATSKYLGEGSATATDMKAMQSPVGKTVRGIAKIFDAQTYTKLGSTLSEGIANTFDQNSRTKVLNYLLSPEGDEKLAAMAKLKPSSVAARQLLGEIFVSAGVAGSGAASGSRKAGPGIQVPGLSRVVPNQ